MKFKLRSFAVLLCSAALLHFAGGCAMLPVEEELPAAPLYKADALEYEQVQVMRGDLQEWDTISCKYEAAVEEQLSFQLDEMEITHVYVSLGEQVTAGQLLAQLDTTEIDKSLEAQREVVSGLQLSLSQLSETRSLQREKEELELERIASRIEDGLATQAEYDAKVRSNTANESAYISQRDYLISVISIEQERLDGLEVDREKHCLYAGIDGTVRKIGSVDRLSSSSTNFIVISDFSTNRFVLTAKEEGMFAVGDTLTVLPTSSKTLEPVEVTVTEILDLSTDKSVKFEVTMQPVVPNVTWQNGDKGKIEYLVQESLDTLYLPEDVVQINPQFSLVYCVDENGVLVTKVVTVGMTADKMVEIKEGLEEGEFVVLKAIR